MSATLAALIVGLQLGASRPADLAFRIHAIDPGASETAAVADVNGDGRLDIISGEYWYEAPDWTRHRFRDVAFASNYIDSFSILPLDADDDGDIDLVDVSWFAKHVAWWRNPHGQAGEARWEEAEISTCCNVEFAMLADMDNDGRPREVLAQENGTGQSWYEARNGAWVKHVVADRSYGHGIGYGDVNGDGRNDILTPRGWLEAPADPRAEGTWTFHEAWAEANAPVTAPGEAAGGRRGAAPAQRAVEQLGFMHVLDVNGDGRNDMITAAAHDFGVFWFEQMDDGSWRRHAIDTAWSQGHASTLADLNGDGQLDLVTGKRLWAHNGADPGSHEPLGLYWYEWRRAPRSPGNGGVEWIRHVIDYGGRVGGGMQVAVADVDADGDPDVVVGGKAGLFFVENLTR